MNPFDEITLDYDEHGQLCKSQDRVTHNISEKACEKVKYRVNQQVFVDHCIMDTPDSQLSPELVVKADSDVIVNKGSNSQVKMRKNGFFPILSAFCAGGFLFSLFQQWRL